MQYVKVKIREVAGGSGEPTELRHPGEVATLHHDKARTHAYSSVATFLLGDRESASTC